MRQTALAWLRPGIILGLVLVLVLSACSPQAGSPTATEAAKAKVLTIGIVTEIKGFDVQNYSASELEAVLSNMYDTLVKTDAKQKFVPGLANSWKQLDPKTWEFSLRKGVTFQNGDAFTAADVKYTFDRIRKDPKQPYYKLIDEVRAVDDYTVDIHTQTPDALMLTRVSRVGSYIMPSKYITDKGFDYYLEHPVGTGPYQFESWTKGSQVTLVKYAGYFGGTPKWDRIVVKTLPEDATRVQELLSGGIDFAVGIPPTDMDRIKSAGLNVASAPAQRVMELVVRTKPGVVTADPRVRAAIDYAIDDKLLADTLLGGTATPIRAAGGIGVSGEDPTLVNTYLYDPAKAKQLLADAGHPDGIDVEMVSSDGRYAMDGETAKAVASMLDKVGIHVKLTLLAWEPFQQRIVEKSMPPIYFVGWNNTLFDAGGVMLRFQSASSKGDTDFSDPQFDAVMKQAALETDAQKRDALLGQAQEILADQRPVIPLFQLANIYGFSKRIGFTPRLDGMLIADEITAKGS